MLVFRFMADIWLSLLASLVVAIGGFLTMGLLGLVAYHLVSPVLDMWFPPLSEWDQSSVWPVLVVMPLLWSPAFILSGVINMEIRRRGWTQSVRVALYLITIYFSAVIAWSFLLNANPTLWH